MRRKDNVFVRSITAEELKKLNKIKNSRNSTLRERALIVLHSYHGKTVPEIQHELLRARNTILHWIACFNQHGVHGLENLKSPGAKEKFTKEIRSEMSKIAKVEPKSLGLAFDYWSLSKLRIYIIEKNIVGDISIESLRSCLLKENIILKRTFRKTRMLKALESQTPKSASKTTAQTNAQ